MTTDPRQKPPVPLEQALEMGMPDIVRRLLDRQNEEELGVIASSLAVKPFLNGKRNPELDLRRGKGVEMLLEYGMPAPTFAEFERDAAGRLAGIRAAKRMPDRIRNSSGKWPLPPVLRGRWASLKADDTWSLLLACVEQEQLSLYDLERYQPSSARRLAISCYDRGVLYEILVYSHEEGTPGTLVIVRSGERLVYLKGHSSRIHQFNKTAPIRLPSVVEAASYLKFFCALIQSDNGNFRILDSPEYLQNAVDAEPDKVAELATLCGEPMADAVLPVEGVFRFACNILYARSIFKAILAVDQAGTVSMLEDTPILKGLRVRDERFVDGVRVLGGYTDDSGNKKTATESHASQ